MSYIPSECSELTPVTAAMLTPLGFNAGRHQRLGEILQISCPDVSYVTAIHVLVEPEC